MTQTEHLQSVILMIAKDIDKLCRDNGIEYYLMGGSAIGAIRHNGFIPWDDDFDIIMTRDYYDKFIKICHKNLDPNKYLIQEGIKDWPLNFTKIRLKGTVIHEYEDDYTSAEQKGIFLDVFYLDNVPDNVILSRMQYFFAKCYLCYLLSVRSYKSATLGKRILIGLSLPLRIKLIREFIITQINKYNKKETAKLGFFYGRTRYKNAIMKREIYGKPQYVRFEDTMLPVPEQYDRYLTQMFGDYMKLPPENERTGLHTISVDFGKY